MKHSLLLLLLTFFSFSAFAQLGNLSGTIFDQNTNQPIRGAAVQIVGLNRATITNELGQYRFADLVAAPYKIELSHVGFATPDY